MMPGWRSLVACLAAALLLAACAGPGQSQSPAASSPDLQRRSAPKKITVAIMGDPPTVSNTINSAGAAGVPGAEEVEDLLNAALVVADKQGSLHAQLAEAVPTVENGLWRVFPDGRMETTWKIRPNTVWHDGTPFTAADLLFTLAVGRDRELAIFHEIMFDSIEGVEAPDPRTIVARWTRPFVQADLLLSSRSVVLPLPSHILEKPYRESRATFIHLAYWNEEYVGTGPFKLKGWARGSHLTLGANDHYVLGRPAIDEIEVRTIPDPNTLAANILAGAVEMTLGRNLSLDEALLLADQWRDGRVEPRFTSWLVMYPQLLNPSPSVLGDARVRKALLHAIDRQGMADSLLRPGISTVAHNFLGLNEPDFADVQDSVVRYDYDPRRAAQLLEEVGYRRAADGVIRDTGGQALTLEIRNRGIEIGQKSMLVSADYWKQLGLQAETIVIPRQRAQDRPYMATFPGLLLYNQPADINFLKRIHGSQTPLPDNSFVGQNNSRYMNPEFDGLIDRYFVTIPRQERTQVLRRIVGHLTDQVLLLGLFYNPVPDLIGNHLVNVKGGAPWNAHQWDVAR